MTVLLPLLAASGLLFVLLFRAIAGGDFKVAEYIASFGAFGYLALLPLFRVTGNQRLIATLVLFVALAQFWAIAYFTSGLFAPILAPVFLVALVGFLVTSIPFGWLAVGGCIGCICSLWAIHGSGAFFPHAHHELQFSVTAVSLCVCYVLCGVIMSYFEAERQTSQKLALEALEALSLAREEAVFANQSKTRFVANISHELRTPLNAIIGYSEILTEELSEASTKNPSEYVEDINKIQRSAKHILRLINELLDVAKLEAGKLVLVSEAFPLPPLIEQIIETIEPLSRSNDNTLTVEWEESTETTMIADAMRLRQILYNLLSNACKFTRQGSVTLRIGQENEFFRFDVCDTGIGISKAEQELLFQPFQQAHGRIAQHHGGTGLGLIVSLQLSRLMGGHITLESEPEQGSTFSLFIPKNPPPSTIQQVDPTEDSDHE